VSVDLALLGRSALCAMLVALATFVLWRDRQAQINRMFVFLMFACVGWILCISTALNVTNTTLAVRLGQAAFAFASLIPFSLLCMFETFLRLSPDPRRGIATRVFGMLCLLFVTMAFSPWIVAGARGVAGRRDLIYGPLYPFFGVFFVLCFGFAVYTLCRGILLASGLVRLQLRYLLLGTLITGAGAVTTNLLIPLVWRTSHYSVIGPYFLLVFALFTTHTIIRHRLMDIRVVIGKGIVYGVASLITGILFIGLVRVARSGAWSYNETLPIGSAVVVAIIIAIVFEPLRTKIQNGINQYLYRRRYDYQRTMTESSGRLSSILDLHLVVTYLSKVVRETLTCETAVVYLRHERQEFFSPASDEAEPQKPENGSARRALPSNSDLVRWLDQTKGTLILGGRDTNDKMSMRAFEELRTLGGEIAIPMNEDRTLSGILVLGPKRSGDAYFAEDIDLLTTLVNQAAGAMRNARLYRQVQFVEAEKRQAERLAAIGGLAAGIAHEIKNPLVAIRTFAELLPERFVDEEFRTEFAAVVIREIDRIDGLVEKLRGLERPAQREFETLDLRGPIEEVLALLRAELEQRRTTVKTVYAGPLPLVEGQRDPLKQLFLNLCRNALDAMPNGGSLTIRLTRREVFGRETLAAEIIDSGIGIPRDLLGRVFDPFVTTKSGGSGLGLAICRGIADAHRARLHAENNEGEPGATLTVEFPIAGPVPATIDSVAHNSEQGRSG
jgi:signal transduction histidine kinase/fumarate reductase subunit D